MCSQAVFTRSYRCNTITIWTSLEKIHEIVRNTWPGLFVVLVISRVGLNSIDKNRSVSSGVNGVQKFLRRVSKYFSCIRTCCCFPWKYPAVWAVTHFEMKMRMTQSTLFACNIFCFSSKHWTSHIKLILGVRNRSLQRLKLRTWRWFWSFLFSETWYPTLWMN